MTAVLTTRRRHERALRDATGSGGMDTPAVLSDRELACRLVPCDRCGACQDEACASGDGQSHGVRRLLAVERGRLDAATGSWLTRGWRS